MILGIGSDIVEITRIQKVYQNFPQRFLDRCFHPKEIKKLLSLNTRKQTPFLAKRFAAKEALVKALGIGFSKGLQMRQIAVLNDENGKPIVSLDPQAEQLFRQILSHPYKIHLSLSDEINYAMAFAVIEKTTQDLQ